MAEDLTMTQEEIDGMFRVTATMEAGILQGVEVGYFNNALVRFAVDHATINVRQGADVRPMTDIASEEMSNIKDQIYGRVNITTAVRIDGMNGSTPVNATI